MERVRGRYCGDVGGFVRVEFMMIVLLCSQDCRKISAQHLNILKKFI